MAPLRLVSDDVVCERLAFQQPQRGAGHQYGYESANRLGRRPWGEVEEDLRTGWSRYERSGESTWDEIEHSVKDAWDRVTGHDQPRRH